MVSANGVGAVHISAIEDKHSALPPTETEEHSVPTPELSYSVFPKHQKWLVILLSTFAASFSPLSSFIFFPAVPSLSEALHVSVSRINLTITSYMIVAALAPAILGDLADTIGRRPVYMIMLGVYLCANVGLALQTNWAALLVLRMMQSFGSASTIVVGYGVVADVATPAERGHFVSGMVLGPNIATAIGPIMGGGLVEVSWRWIFWLLSILSCSCLISVVLFLPETARSIVDNGSKETHGIHRTLLSHFASGPAKPVAPTTSCHDKNVPTPATEASTAKKLHMPDVTASLKLLREKDCFLVVLIFGMMYMNLSSLQASMSTLFVRLYGLSEIEAGLIYLPSGIGSIIGAYSAGYILKHNYRLITRKHNITINNRGGDDLTTFPIEKARLRSAEYTISTVGLCTIGYGWSLRYRTHIAVPLLLQFFIGLCTAIVFNSSGTLLTDLHPKSPSTASAANSIVRCILAAVGTAVVQPLIDSIGVQWTFTLFGFLSLGCLVASWLEVRFGRHWRDQILTKGVQR